jgi:hypothetical protein
LFNQPLTGEFEPSKSNSHHLSVRTGPRNAKTRWFGWFNSLVNEVAH